MASCTGRVLDLLDGLAGPAVLVGHSFGGAVVSQVCELRPEAVATAVYLCAFLLRDGRSVWRHGLPAAGSPGASQVLGPQNLVVDEAAGTVDLRPQVIPAFYAGCSEPVRQRAIRLWRPEPLAPLRTPLQLSERFERVPRDYICCPEDQVLPVEAQRRMTRLTPCRRVADLDAGHSPFLSDPGALAAALVASTADGA